MASSPWSAPKAKAAARVPPPENAIAMVVGPATSAGSRNGTAALAAVAWGRLRGTL